tara:strand:+ start:185 stop:577 length:393 start_codon:yes stop_codon:yes gene_type:complete
MKEVVNVSSAAVILIAFSSMLGGQNDTNQSVNTDRLSVVIVEETESRSSIPPSQLNAMTSVKWKNYVKQRGGQWRLLDQDSDIKKEEGWVKESFDLERSSLPWLVVSNVNSLKSIPMPENIEGLMKEIKE